MSRDTQPSHSGRKVRASIVALVAASLMLATVTAASAQSGVHTPRIVNGSDVGGTLNGSKWEFFVGLVSADQAVDYDAQFCGGSRIGTKLIITAAHCVTDPIYNGSEVPQFRIPSTVEILEGTKTLSSTSTSDGTRIGVDAIYVHPDYNANTTANDVAVVRMSDASALDTISIADDGEMTTLGGDGGGYAVGSDTEGPWIGGWGNTCSSDGMGSADADCDPPSYASTMAEVKIPIKSDAACATDGPTGFSAVNMLCGGVLDTDGVGSTSNGQDTCQGDSGGPLIAGNDGGMIPLRLVGLTSWGIGCATDTYGVYTRLDAFRTWVNSIDNAADGPGGIQDVTGLSVNPASTSFLATWTAPAAGPAPDGYAFFLKNDNYWYPIDTTAGTTAEITSLSPSTEYTFAVRSYDENGSSTGVSSTFTTDADTTAPSRPGRPRLTNRGKRSLTFRWTASTDADAVASYRVYMKKSGSYRQVGTTTSTSFRKRSLKRKHKYCFRIKAVDNTGNLSAPSSYKCFKTK